MMKRIIVLLGLLISSVTLLLAQSETDAYRMSQRQLDGSARFTGMAGAFSAVGGDLSAIERNPAAIAVFHNDYASITALVNASNTMSNAVDGSHSEQNTKVKLGNLGVVFSRFNERSGNGFTFAITGSSPLRISRRIQGRNSIPQVYSLADYVAAITPDDIKTSDLGHAYGYDPYQQNIPWFSVLGYNAGWISPTNTERGPFESTFFYPTKPGSNEYSLYGPSVSDLSYNEEATQKEVEFAFGFNYQDRLYSGFSLKVTSLDYRISSEYSENFTDGDYLTLGNTLSTSGKGFSGSLGVIGRPTDFLRLGIAFHTPTIMFLTDAFEANASSRYSHAIDPNTNKPYPQDMWVMKSNTPESASLNYRLLSPSRLTFGIASTFRRYGLLSFDYELIPYGTMRLYNALGKPYNYDNRVIPTHYTLAHTFRIGGEFFPIQSFALRFGYMYKTSPMKTVATKTLPGNNALAESFLVVGTLPHFILPSHSHTYTLGAGYRFNSVFSVDAAFVYSKQNESLYAFPTLTKTSGDPLLYASEPIGINQRDMRFYITMNFTL